MHTVHGRAQHYAWGDPSSIPEMLGQAPDGQPWAEWWMGTHPLAPSTVDDGAPLQSVAGDLPYLLKFMAAAQPLSLQTHPDQHQAAAGFEREEQLGIPRDSPQRLYRDPHAKPEMLCALTTFDTLCGFRPVDDTLALLHELDAHDLAALLAARGAGHDGRGAVSTQIRHCVNDRGVPEARIVRKPTLVTELAATYPGDPSVVVTLLLNRVLLGPGEAVFLGPGNLHAYLRGFGVEVMSNSDNVVRGGMTVKHVDVEELLAVLDFDPLARPRRRLHRGRARLLALQHAAAPRSSRRDSRSPTVCRTRLRGASCCCGSAARNTVSAVTWPPVSPSSWSAPPPIFLVQES